MTESWITAEDAMDRLRVRPQTLYAYVSRGLVEAKPQDADSRRSLYRAADIDGLAGRKARGRRPADVASHTMAWGEPILASAVSTVTRGRLYYRGQDAAALAQDATLKDVAVLLWDAGDSLPSGAGGPAIPSSASPSMKARAFSMLAGRAASDPPAMGRGAAALLRDASGVLGAMVGAIAGRTGPGAAHDRLAEGWGADAAGADLIRRAMVLLADHELNASTFAARVTASTGASLAASALAGLAALSGPRHGGHFAQVQGFLADARSRGPAAAVRDRLEQGLAIPGFGHPLYPEGDPRAQALICAFPLSADNAEAAEAGRDATGQEPNIDFALCALTQSAGLPEDAPFGLFAAGRTVGWLAHALEQHQTGALIRPRARYVGPQPAEAP